MILLISKSSLIPKRVSAKSYFTGSSGEIFLKPEVTSITVRIFACFRLVRPIPILIRCMWVSSGTRSIDGQIPSHPPGSTSSFLIIHLKNRFILLHALPFSGRAIKCPGLLFPLHNCFTKNCIAGSIVSSPGDSPSLKHPLRDPYFPMTFFAPKIRADR